MNATVAENGFKQCTGCKTNKPTGPSGEFYRQASSKDGFKPRCKECLGKERKKYRQREDVLERARNRQRLNTLRKYGLTPQQYWEMHESQGGLCDICREPIELIGSDRANRREVACVDHCHSTGRVRSLLCSGCNKGLGLFGENPEVMRRAAEYIENHINTQQSINEQTDR